MSQFSDRVWRAVRSNLNELLDRIDEFEEQGGFQRVIEDIAEGEGIDFDQLGGGGEPGEGASGKAYDEPRSADEKTIEDYYANLEVSVGADKEEVKKSYRRLMRKYHPDKFNDDEEMEKLATELTQELTNAYQKVIEDIERRKKR